MQSPFHAVISVRILPFGVILDDSAVLPTSKTLDRKQLYCKMMSCDVEAFNTHCFYQIKFSGQPQYEKTVRDSGGRFGSLQVQSNVYRIGLC